MENLDLYTSWFPSSKPDPALVRARSTASIRTVQRNPIDWDDDETSLGALVESLKPRTGRRAPPVSRKDRSRQGVAGIFHSMGKQTVDPARRQRRDFRRTNDVRDIDGATQQGSVIEGFARAVSEGNVIEQHGTYLSKAAFRTMTTVDGWAGGPRAKGQHSTASAELPPLSPPSAAARRVEPAAERPDQRPAAGAAPRVSRRAAQDAHMVDVQRLMQRVGFAPRERERIVQRAVSQGELHEYGMAPPQASIYREAERPVRAPNLSPGRKRRPRG